MHWIGSICELRSEASSATTESLVRAGLGGTAGLITLPADVIKIRFQLGLGEIGIQMTAKQFVKEILSTHGFRGLFNGLVPRLLKVSPGCAIVMTTYEYCKSYCQKYDKQDSKPFQPQWQGETDNWNKNYLYQKFSKPKISILTIPYINFYNLKQKYWQFLVSILYGYYWLKKELK